MWKSPACIALTMALAVALPTAQDDIPAALRDMADAERAFARTAAVKGVRDAFLEFFADDALAFTPLPTSAKEGLRKQPSRPFSVQELVWEPRAGDVAASEEIGWLTGPATFANHEAGRKGYSCYLSVWRRQPDGRWRVFIDIGITAPEPVSFASGFTRVSLNGRYTGSETKDASTRSLTEADRQLNADMRARGVAQAYSDRLTSVSRLHRNGMIPLTGKEPIATWLGQKAAGLTAQTGAADASRAGDLGYAYGTYESPGPPAESGPYVRIWARDAAGRWYVMADVAHATPAERGR